MPGRMPEARHCGCSRQGMADAGGKAGLMRESRPRKCAIHSLEYARRKAWQMR
jgi:hypothetical protein